QTFSVTFPPTTGQQRTSTGTTLFTANGTQVGMVRDASAPLETNALAAAQALGTDTYDTVMIVNAPGQTAITDAAAAIPVASTFVAPTPLGGATATTAATTPYPMIASTWQTYANAI